MKYKWFIRITSTLERGGSSNGWGCFSNPNKADLCAHSAFRAAKTCRLWSWTSGFQPLQGHEGSFKAFLDLIGHYANRLCGDGWERVDTGMQCFAGVVTHSEHRKQKAHAMYKNNFSQS